MPVSFISPRFQAIDDRGRTLVGGKLYVYANKTTIPSVTYQDAQGITLNTNPIILDARGEARVFLGETIAYTFVLKSAADVLIWSQDDITGNAGSSGGSTVPPATEEIAGIARLATEEEASVGTNHQTIMTPFRVRQVMTAWQLPRATTDQYGVTRFAKAMDDDPTLTAMNPALTTTFVSDEIERLANTSIRNLQEQITELRTMLRGGWYEFNSVGTHTLSVPLGIESIYVSGCGAGGGGNGSQAGESVGGKGGSAGTSVFRYRIRRQFLSRDLTIVVGAGGDGGKGSVEGSRPTEGKAGGTTSVTFDERTPTFYLSEGYGGRSAYGEVGETFKTFRGFGAGGNGGARSFDSRFGRDGENGAQGYVLIEW